YKPDNDELPSLEQTATPCPTPVHHLMEQVHMVELPADQALCATLIIGNLDVDGYFKEPPLEDIAQEVEVDLDVAERALKQVQRFDPVGCAARTLQESLLMQ